MISQSMEQRKSSMKCTSRMNVPFETSSFDSSESMLICENCFDQVPKNNYSIHVATCIRNKFFCTMCQKSACLSEKDKHFNAKHLSNVSSVIFLLFLKKLFYYDK